MDDVPASHTPHSEAHARMDDVPPSLESLEITEQDPRIWENIKVPSSLVEDAGELVRALNDFNNETAIGSRSVLESRLEPLVRVMRRVREQVEESAQSREEESGILIAALEAASRAAKRPRGDTATGGAGEQNSV